jgi:hypothetical protein
MSMIKDSFSVRGSDLDTARAMLESMAKDLAANLPIPKKGNAAPGQAVPPTPTGHDASQTTPLNAANLEKQTQALNKTHNRTNSKSSQPPPAPIATQPPFQFGAQKSPIGQPTYLGKPAVTQENLQLPAARKKAKTGADGSATSPQIKAPSPETKRQPEIKAPAPPRPVFVCPELDCEMHTAGFPNQDALNVHIQEEHIKPFEDPYKFVQENLALALGLDLEGQPMSNAASQDASQPVAMASSLSRQGQTPTSKPDLVSTPMSRDASMMRQTSATGDNKATPGKSSAGKPDSTPSIAPGKLVSVKSDLEASSTPFMEDLWAGSTIDPQSLLATFAPLESVAGGLISDVNLYRSLTPNDTPESSKDSGTSEPNSDISDGANIEIDLNWQPIDADLLVDMNNINMDMEGFEGFDKDLMSDPSQQFPSWEDLSADFSKPFQLDSSFYSMDTA